MLVENKKEIINLLMKKNYMVSPDVIPLFDNIPDYDLFLKKLNSLDKISCSKVFTKNDFDMLIKDNETFL